MGSPRRMGKHYDTPKKTFSKARIEEEKKLKEEYGLKNKRELWRAATIIRKARKNARAFLGKFEEKSEKSEKLLKRLQSYGMLPKNATLSDVLNLSAKDILERRLQTIVYKKGLAKSIKQSRQLIVHGFIAVNGRKVTSPSYLVKLNEENKISYYKPININNTEAQKQQGKQENEAKEEVQNVQSNNG